MLLKSAMPAIAASAQDRIMGLLPEDVCCSLLYPSIYHSDGPQEHHGRSAVSISTFANGALGEHRRHDTDGMRLEIAAPGCRSMTNAVVAVARPSTPCLPVIREGNL